MLDKPKDLFSAKILIIKNRPMGHREYFLSKECNYKFTRKHKNMFGEERETFKSNVQESFQDRLCQNQGNMKK